MWRKRSDKLLCLDALFHKSPCCGTFCPVGSAWIITTQSLIVDDKMSGLHFRSPPPISRMAFRGGLLTHRTGWFFTDEMNQWFMPLFKEPRSAAKLLIIWETAPCLEQESRAKVEQTDRDHSESFLGRRHPGDALVKYCLPQVTVPPGDRIKLSFHQ